MAGLALASECLLIMNEHRIYDTIGDAEVAQVDNVIGRKIESSGILNERE